MLYLLCCSASSIKKTCMCVKIRYLWHEAEIHTNFRQRILSIHYKPICIFKFTTSSVLQNHNYLEVWKYSTFTWEQVKLNYWTWNLQNQWPVRTRFYTHLIHPQEVQVVISLLWMCLNRTNFNSSWGKKSHTGRLWIRCTFTCTFTYLRTPLFFSQHDFQKDRLRKTAFPGVTL